MALSRDFERPAVLNEDSVKLGVYSLDLQPAELPLSSALSAQRMADLHDIVRQRLGTDARIVVYGHPGHLPVAVGRRKTDLGQD